MLLVNPWPRSLAGDKISTGSIFVKLTTFFRRLIQLAKEESAQIFRPVTGSEARLDWVKSKRNG